MSISHSIRHLGLEKAFLKYLMLSTPSPDLGSSTNFNPVGFSVKDFSYYHPNFGTLGIKGFKKGLSFYDHIYEQIHNSSSERKTWLMKDILAYWLNIAQFEIDAYPDGSNEYNNHFLGVPVDTIYKQTTHAAQYDFVPLLKDGEDSELNDAVDSIKSLVMALRERSLIYCKPYESKLKAPSKDYSEVVAWRIEKLKVIFSTTDGTVLQAPRYETIQNFWFLNDDGFNSAEVLDTQVKPAAVDSEQNRLVSYVYRIHSYNLVFATKYTYDLKIPKQEADNQIQSIIKAYRDNKPQDLPLGGSIGFYVPEYINPLSDLQNLAGESSDSDEKGPLPAHKGDAHFGGLNNDNDGSINKEGGKFKTPLRFTDNNDGLTFNIEKEKLYSIAEEARNDPNEDIVPTPLYGRFFAEFDVISEPNLMIVEQIIYQTDPIIVASNPPMPPEMEVFPYQGDSDRIMIKLSATTGFHRDIPIAITSDDHDRIIRTYIAQVMSLERAAEESNFYEKNDRFRTIMDFENDDFQSNFELFELSGMDYSQSGLKPSDFGAPLLYKGDSNTFFFNLNVAVNTKYYFMARSVDRHGQRSNPTAIYEFEMVRDGPQGGIIPVFKTFQQPAKKPTDQKIAKQYLSVKASDVMNDKILNSIKLNNNGEISIDDEHDTFINKKFKMRLTSKHTGRKLDLNIKFKLKDKGVVSDPRELQELSGKTNIVGPVLPTPHEE